MDEISVASSGYSMGLATGLMLGLVIGLNSVRRRLRWAVDHKIFKVTDIDGNPLTSDEVISNIKPIRKMKEDHNL